MGELDLSGASDLRRAPGRAGRNPFFLIITYIYHDRGHMPFVPSGSVIQDVGGINVRTSVQCVFRQRFLTGHNICDYGFEWVGDWWYRNGWLFGWLVGTYPLIGNTTRQAIAIPYLCEAGIGELLFVDLRQVPIFVNRRSA